MLLERRHIVSTLAFSLPLAFYLGLRAGHCFLEVSIGRPDWCSEKRHHAFTHFRFS